MKEKKTKPFLKKILDKDKDTVIWVNWRNNDDPRYLPIKEIIVFLGCCKCENKNKADKECHCYLWDDVCSFTYEEKVKVKCTNCKGTGQVFAHSKDHEENQHLSCWACSCGNEECPKCKGLKYVEKELYRDKK